MNELVSIVVPIYNMGDSIEICVDSLIKQDYKNIEIILVDDGSKDNSYEVCCALAEKDSRITAYTTPNRGSGPARNYGIEHANGRYIFFPDADDYLVENAISTMLSAMENGKYDLVVFGYKNLNQDGKEVRVKEYPEFDKNAEEIRNDYSDYVSATGKYGIQGAPWNKFFDLDVVKKYNIEYPPLRRHQDDGFIARYMCRAKNIHFIDKVLYIHYVNDLKREWQKYPVDYIDAVIGLYKTRKETILTWNTDDKKTCDAVEREYICAIIKSLELSFSPKMKLNKKSRIEWIENAVNKSNLAEKQGLQNVVGAYQRKIMNIIADKNYKKFRW